MMTPRTQSAVLEALQKVARTEKPPKGVVLHSPTVEEEEKDLEKEFIKKYEEAKKTIKEHISQDYRK